MLLATEAEHLRENAFEFNKWKGTPFVMSNFRNIFDVRLKNKDQDKTGLMEQIQCIQVDYIKALSLLNSIHGI